MGRHPRPVVALTTQIAATYQAVLNSQTGAGESATSQANSFQLDTNGHLIVKLHDRFNDRYVAAQALGQGSYGRVILAHTLDQARTPVAIKILKPSRDFQRKGEEEAQILACVNHAGPGIATSLIETFMHGNHFCVVTEAMGKNLYQLLKSTGFRGFPLQTIRAWAIKLFGMFRRLREPDLRLIHTDCKPENILVPFSNAGIENIKLCDFGSAVQYPGGTLCTYVQSRYYRSPEVLLQYPYDYQIDIWSLGCLLVEMHTGKVIFPAKSSPMLCHMMISLLGVPPPHMLVLPGEDPQIRPGASRYFRVADSEYLSEEKARLDRLSPQESADFGWPARLDLRGLQDASDSKPTLSKSRSDHSATKDSILVVPTKDVLDAGDASPVATRHMTLRELVVNPNYRGQAGHSDADYSRFYDLISNLLVYDPRKRWGPDMALKSQFLVGP